MSFFQNLLSLFQSKAKPEAALPSAPLLNRAPRVHLKPLHNVIFARSTPPCADLIPLANLSSKGVGFFKIPGQVWPNIGEVIKGELRIGDEKFTIAARVIHNTQIVIGCSFILSPSHLSSTLENYFATEITAQSLTEVNQDILKPEPDGIPRWYRGKGTSELYLVEDNGKIQRFHMSYLGTYVEGAPGTSPRFSFIIGEDPSLDENSTEETSAKYKASALVRPTSSPTPEMVQSAIRFISSVSALSESQKAALHFYIQGVQNNDHD